MIDVSRLYCGSIDDASDALRYRQRVRSHGPLRHEGVPRPIVVYNCTARCNLHCVHCYSASTADCQSPELSSRQAMAMLDDTADFGCPVVLFSGGEPLLRPDLYDLLAHARSRGMGAVVSTNGTLISAKAAESLAQAGTSYVGVSLDGLNEANDAFRRRHGAFDAALAGVRNCKAAGVKVGLRLTMSRRNFDQLAGIFDLVEREGIPRVCFYHLAYAGRGGDMRADDLSHQQTRQALDLIINRTCQLHSRGKPVQVLTVDNHADGPYLYMRLLAEDPTGAAHCLQLLQVNGGNSSGCRVACVSWNGDVMPDQFWRQHVLGNVTHRPFSEIWSDESHPLLAALRHRKSLLTGRCSRCRFLDACNGNLRARAEAVSGDPWGDDGACYLTDAEISL